jgi:hypothetical protein
MVQKYRSRAKGRNSLRLLAEFPIALLREVKTVLFRDRIVHVNVVLESISAFLVDPNCSSLRLSAILCVGIATRRIFHGDNTSAV